MKLTDYWKKLQSEQEKLITDIALSAMVSRNTATQYLTGRIKPTNIRQKAIAEKLGKPILELFPLEQYQTKKITNQHINSMDKID